MKVFSKLFMLVILQRTTKACQQSEDYGSGLNGHTYRGCMTKTVSGADCK